MKQYKVLLYFGLILFVLALLAAFYFGDFFYEAGLIYGQIWGKLMLLDLYMGFVIFSILIFVLENSWVHKVIWVVSLMCLGNLMALAYLLYRYDVIHKIFAKENI